MKNSIKKFTIFANESKENLDPFGEENWNDDDSKRKTKEELVNDAVDTVMEDLHGYRDWLYDMLHDYFHEMQEEDIRNFLGIEGEICPYCNGTGEAGNIRCPLCQGRGIVE